MEVKRVGSHTRSTGSVADYNAELPVATNKPAPWEVGGPDSTTAFGAPTSSAYNALMMGMARNGNQANRDSANANKTIPEIVSQTASQNTNTNAGDANTALLGIGVNTGWEGTKTGDIVYDSATGTYTNVSTGQTWQSGSEPNGEPAGTTSTPNNDDSGGITVNNNWQEGYSGNVGYDSTTDTYWGVDADGKRNYWKHDDNGNSYAVDENGNPIETDTNTTETAEEESTDTPTGVESDDNTTGTGNSAESNTDNPFASIEDEINARYDALIEAGLINIENNVALGKSQYEADLAKALPQYQQQREQQDLLTMQNAQKIKEYAFYTGDTGGMSRQDILQNVNSGQEIIGAINLQQQMLEDDTQRAITELILQGNSDAALLEAQYAAERAAALESERIRMQESNASWQQWLTEQTGYMPDGSKTLDRQALEYDMGQSTGTTDSTTTTGRYSKYLTDAFGLSASSSSSKGSTSGQGNDTFYDENGNPITDGTEDTVGNPYAPSANSTQIHAQYYQDENGNWVWQPYYTNDAYKTTPADYMAPSDTDDPVNWIINSAASYAASDGAEVNSPINDAMQFNNIMSYVAANFDGLSEADQDRLLAYYGLTEEDLYYYLFNEQDV